MSYIGGGIGDILGGSAIHRSSPAVQMAQQQMFNQQRGLDHFYSNGLLDSLRQAGIATHRPAEVRGETFRQWHDRYQARVAELDREGQIWPWVEGQNWKADIDACADLYGCPVG